MESKKNQNKTESSSNPEKLQMSHQHEEDKSSTTDESFSMTSGSMRELTNIELIKKAEEFVDTLELEKAVALYDEGLQRFPNDTVILDGYSELLH